MSNGHELSGSGSNQSQPKKDSPGSISSDSSSAIALLTEENLKKLEKEYINSKEAFNKQKIEDYIKQSNLALSSEETTTKSSGQLVWDEEPEGSSSSLPTTWSKDPKEVHWEMSEEISRKDELSTELVTDSLSSALLIGSKLEESKQHVDDSLASSCSSRHQVKDVTTQTEWSYSVIEEKSSSEGTKWSSLKLTKHQVGLYSDSEKHPEREESKETTEMEKEAAAEEGEEYRLSGLCEQEALDESIVSARVSPRPELEDQVLCRKHMHESDWILNTLYMDEALKSQKKLHKEALHRAENVLNLLNIKDNTLREVATRCKFCSGPEKPVPTVVDLKEQPHENFFCCRSYKEIFDTVIKELMNEDDIQEEIDIAPHPHRSQTELRSDIKAELLRQLSMEGFENFREIFQRYLQFAAWSKISFRLSEENEYTVRPEADPSKKHRPTSPPPEDLLELDHDFVAEHLKHCHPLEPVTRYYPDGQTFLLLLPDGTGQVYYPSGNMALLITYSQGSRFTYFVLEDSRCMGIRGFFGNCGRATCCHPNGHIWVALDLCAGFCFHQEGTSHRRWNWWALSPHVHSPPFQTIFMKLNAHITVEIVAQDQICLTFSSHSDHIHFNVGARLKLKDPETRHLLQRPSGSEELFLEAKRSQLRSLLLEIQRRAHRFWHPLPR